MFDKELHERSRYFDRIALEYGREEILPTRVYEVAAELMRPHELGLSPLTHKLYAASSERDIVRVLELFPTKGASYYVRWGLSLAFVPHKWNPKLRWHRTLKSARFDVWENPFEYFDLEKKHWRESERFLVSRLNGETYLRKQMMEMWTALAPAVREWFASTTALPGVLRALDEQIARPGASSHHSPSPSLVRAFSLSRMGRVEEGRLALARFLQDSHEDPVSRENLMTALASVGEG